MACLRAPGHRAQEVREVREHRDEVGEEPPHAGWACKSNSVHTCAR
jgi:hypothetical protein